MSRLLSFQAGVETAVKRQRMTTTYTSEWTTYSAKTDAVVENILMAGFERCVCVCVYVCVYVWRGE